MDPRTGSEHYKQCLNTNLTFCLGFGSVKLLNLNLNEGSGSGSEWTRTTHYITSFHFPNPTCLFVSWWIHLGTLFVCDKVQITWKWLKSAQQKLHKQTNNNHWSFFETSCSLPLTMMWGGQHESAWPCWFFFDNEHCLKPEMNIPNLNIKFRFVFTTCLNHTSGCRFRYGPKTPKPKPNWTLASLQTAISWLRIITGNPGFSRVICTCGEGTGFFKKYVCSLITSGKKQMST